MKPNLLTLALLLCCTAAYAADPIPLWPAAAPGETGDIGEEKDTTKPDRKVPPEKYVTRLGNVSKPTITVFRPADGKANGACVIVCPGGGYNILAYDLEGTEVCKWLNDLGVTAVLLKYRVPARKGMERHAAPLQDAQRAIGLVRHRAGEFGIDPNRIGILGFSAGGHLSAAASNIYDQRTYPPIDDADKASCRPDFTILIYPAYLVTKEDKTKISPELKITAKTPPAILVMTQDDGIGVENVYAYALALKAVKVPAEVHTYPTGGHGYGLRPSNHLVHTWPARVGEWMKSQGFLDKKAEGAE
jgi:acetyl esterase/lipase